MVRVENHCCGCAVPGYPCMGASCPLLKVEVHYCDNCNEETQLYHYEGSELCIDCIEERLEKVE